MGNFVSYANAQSLMQGVSDKFATLNGAYILRGSVTFANLPAVLTKTMVGYTYNVSNEFTTDARFIEGAGKKYAAGTNVSVADQSGYAAVTPVGTEDPSAEGWYELVSDEYVLTTDASVDSSKTYYEYVERLMFDVVGNFVDVDGILTDIQAISDMISGEFDETLGYENGDVVVYEKALYKFTSAHTANDPWDPEEVTATTVAELIAAAEPDSLTTAQVNALLALLD